MPERTVVMEIALALQDLANLEKQVWVTPESADPAPPILSIVQLAERKKIGDIIAIRKPWIGIGRKETSAYLWLTVRGKWKEVYELSKPWFEGGVKVDKRRYCIPIERLVEISPSFSKSRALDLDDFYQPFLPTDKETGLFLFNDNPIYDISGLVYDKAKGKYL